MASSPIHENDNLRFEACRTSPTLAQEREQESISVSASTVEPTIQLTASDPLQHWPFPLTFSVVLSLSLCSSAIYVLVSSHSEQQLVVYKFMFVSVFPFFFHFYFFVFSSFIFVKVSNNSFCVYFLLAVSLPPTPFSFNPYSFIFTDALVFSLTYDEWNSLFDGLFVFFLILQNKLTHNCLSMNEDSSQ